jgi:hypothetical protein
MIRREFIWLLLLLFLFSVGCNRGDPKFDNYDYHTGTQGLSLRFLPQTPPSTVYSGDEIEVLVEISNKGAYSIDGGSLYLTGFDKNIIQIPENFFSFDAIEGKDQYFREGGKIVLDRSGIHNVDISLPNGVDRHNTRMEAIACYNYETTASIPICIDPNPRVDTHDACITNSVGSSGGQGGPVAVTNVQVESGYGKIRLVISFANVGKGSVMDYNECPFGYEYDALGNIDYYDIELSDVSLDCSPPANSLKLNNGVAKLYCHADNLDTEQAAFTTPLNIIFGYDYKVSTSTSLDIRAEI